MNRYIIDTSGISKMFELTKSGRMRKVARLWYVNQMDIEDIAKAMGYGKSVIISEIMLINKLIENNVSCKTCSQCGETFYTGQRGTQICPNCKEQNKKEREELQKEVYKAGKPKQSEKSKKKRKFKPINQVLRDLEKYNKKNKTLLSYGQYVALVGE